MIGRWAESYVGIPFLDGGDSRSGIGCWNLVRHVLRDRCGIDDLPSYGPISADDLLSIAREMKSPDAEIWTEAIDPRPFDVVLMSGRVNGGSAPVHVGVMVTANHLLHVEVQSDSVIVPIDHWSVRDRIDSLYRHRKLLLP